MGFILSSKIRKNILDELSNHPKRPMEIANKIQTKQQNVSRCLFELEKEGLVECLNPSKRAWRVYALTKKGKGISKEL